MSNEAGSEDLSRYPQPSASQSFEVVSKLESVRSRIASSSQTHARRPPRLVAISKLHPPSSILAAYRDAEPRQLHFGENYAQELRDKAKVLPRGIRWHFVGNLQSSKAKMLAAIPNLYLLETLDSEKTATLLDKALSNRTPTGSQSESTSEPLRVYLQVNTSGELNKSGLPPLDLQGSDTAKQSPLLSLAKHVILHCPNLTLSGLMTIGSRSASDSHDSEAENQDFATLRATRTALIGHLRSDSELSSNKDASRKYSALLSSSDSVEEAQRALELSMGMSGDLDAAIRSGSDNVRVGTDCFGQRMSDRDKAYEAMKQEMEWDVENGRPGQVNGENR
ncbi:Proline synthetase co-transcribed protein [Ceraceosorus bombacis]|uniref:Pyridoxal phosphate homeostasis protein n=1 Tax=Ceraceosorus bombacis TaxID=401625 RepID=A0A0P1BCN9_9BASI|nr:Proline synthetase co-transcribed protein [Ceraceosorus bombacis]